MHDEHGDLDGTSDADGNCQLCLFPRCHRHGGKVLTDGSRHIVELTINKMDKIALNYLIRKSYDQMLADHFRARQLFTLRRLQHYIICKSDNHITYYFTDFNFERLHRLLIIASHKVRVKPFSSQVRSIKQVEECLQ